jgi:hypothetical protein
MLREGTTLAIRAHFDGRVFVPDEPVDLPLDQPVVVNSTRRGDENPVNGLPGWEREREFIKQRMKLKVPPQPRTWTREDLYE